MSDYREPRFMPPPAAATWHKPNPPPFSRRPVDRTDYTAKAVEQLQQKEGLDYKQALKKLSDTLRKPPTRR